MKHRMGLLLGVLVLTQGVAALDTWAPPGRVSAQAGVGLQRTGLAQVSGGMNLTLTQVDLSPEFPLDLGLAGRASVANMGVAVGVFGAARWSWKSLHTGLDWVNRLELSLGLGVGLVPLVGLDAFGGLSYHLDSRWAVLLEGTPFGAVVGAAYQF